MENDLFWIEGSTLREIGDAIRSRTGGTAKIPPLEMKQKILSISGGSGGGGESSELVKWVTFMNGNTELYRMPVLVGDECKDPQVRGDIDIPTKDSTPQYSYTFYGWGASDGGSADSNILKNITEDKTVYAIYSSATRYYTITFYDADGTTVLKTTSVAYGRTPSYTPAKEGFDFLEWTPAITTVTGEASYTAVWEERTVFAYGQEITNTWDEIFSYTERGLHTVKYLPGSYKYVTVNGFARKAKVAATETDDRYDGLGKAAISWVVDEIVGASHYNAQSQVLVSGGWKTFPKQNTNYWRASSANIKFKTVWTISMPSGGTLTISYNHTSGGTSSLYQSTATLSVNGASKLNSVGVNKSGSVTVNCAAGEKVEVEATFHRSLLASSSYYFQVGFTSDDEYVYDNVTGDVPNTYQNGTGVIGAWRYSALRTYVAQNFNIESVVKNRIVTVTKISETKDGGVRDTVTTADDIWIPGTNEIGGLIDNGIKYPGLYPTHSDRAKGQKWYLRDAYMEGYAAVIDTTGEVTYETPTNQNGVVIGFCTW